MPIQNGQEATAIVKEYAGRAFETLYWRDVEGVDFNAANKEWRVVFVASPTLIAPYWKYEAVVDADTGNIIRFKKLEDKG